MLEIKNASFGYLSKKKKKVILDGICMNLKPGELWCLLGANGSGKTTMYRSILQFLPLLDGEICIDGKNLSDMSRKEIAKLISYVPQYHTPPFPYSVYEVVMMGRGVHISDFASPSKQDEKIVCETLERMKILSLKDEIYTQISGGQRQLVLIARALAQQTKYIFMDEPTSNLDYGNQMHVLKEICNLSKEGIGICFSTHNPEHAFLTNAHVFALEGGNRWSAGMAEELITEELLSSMYGLETRIDIVTGKHGKVLRRIHAELE
jgi:iron complex transport system ATP-binding protein